MINFLNHTQWKRELDGKSNQSPKGQIFLAIFAAMCQNMRENHATQISVEEQQHQATNRHNLTDLAANLNGLQEAAIRKMSSSIFASFRKWGWENVVVFC